MRYVKIIDTSTDVLEYTEDYATTVNAAATVVTVGNVAELETAVAAQIAGQTIEILAGDYVLTTSMTILLAATGGGLKGIGTVSITGAAAADEAILIDPAVSTATFEYSL